MFDVSELDRFPDVLIDMMKSYIEPELRLGKVGIACEDNEDFKLDENWNYWFDLHPIFGKHWTKRFKDGRVLICYPERLISNFDEKVHVDELIDELNSSEWYDDCGCGELFHLQDEIWVRSSSTHVYGRSIVPVELDVDIFCNNCASDCCDTSRVLKTQSLSLRFTDNGRHTIDKKLKINFLEPRNSPINTYSILTEMSGFTIIRYLVGLCDELIQTIDGTRVDDWATKKTTEVLDLPLEK